jgi:hypothetical protein
MTAVMTKLRLSILLLGHTTNIVAIDGRRRLVLLVRRRSGEAIAGHVFGNR